MIRLTISDSSHLHHLLTHSPSHQISVQTFYISKGWKWWQEFINWHNWQCSFSSLYLLPLPSPFYGQVSVEHWKRIQGNETSFWLIYWTVLLHTSLTKLSFSVLSSDFCQTLKSLVATSEWTYICNNFIPHLLFSVTPSFSS